MAEAAGPRNPSAAFRRTTCRRPDRDRGHGGPLVAFSGHDAGLPGIWSSADGTSWHPVPIPREITIGAWLSDIAVGHGLAVLAGHLETADGNGLVSAIWWAPASILRPLTQPPDRQRSGRASAADAATVEPRPQSVGRAGGSRVPWPARSAQPRQEPARTDADGPANRSRELVGPRPIAAIWVRYFVRWGGGRIADAGPSSSSSTPRSGHVEVGIRVAEGEASPTGWPADWRSSWRSACSRSGPSRRPAEPDRDEMGRAARPTVL